MKNWVTDEGLDKGLAITMKNLRKQKLSWMREQTETGEKQIRSKPHYGAKGIHMSKQYI